ncbi:MAG: hypothetical protein GXO10_01655 [Crenarchaeota archaeon]|nr:hypothetical protein [Thermoproteota archaeon]
MKAEHVLLCKGLLLSILTVLLALIAVAHAVYLISYYGYVCPDTNATLFGKLLNIEHNLPGSPPVFTVSPYFRYVQSVPLYHKVLFVVDLRRFLAEVRLLVILRTGYGAMDRLVIDARGGCFYLFNTTPFIRTTYTFIAAIEYAPTIEKVLGLTQVVVTVPPSLKVVLRDIKDLTTGQTYTTPYVKLVPGHVYQVDLDVINLGISQLHLNVTFYLSKELKLLSQRSIYIYSLPSSTRRVSVKFRVSKLIPSREKVYVNVTLSDYSSGYVYFAGYLNLTVMPSLCRLVLENYKPKKLDVNEVNNVTLILKDVGGPCNITNITVQAPPSLEISKISYNNKTITHNETLLINLEAVPKTVKKYVLTVLVSYYNPYSNSEKTLAFKLNLASYNTIKILIEARNGTILRHVCARAGSIRICGQGSVTLSGGLITISVPQEVKLGRYVKLAFSGWNNGATSNTITISANETTRTLIAYFTVEYYVKLTYPEGTLYEGWFNRNYDLAIQVPGKIDEGNGTVLIFDGWYCKNGYLENTTSLTVDLTRPLICTAVYSKYYRVLIIVLLDGKVYESFSKLVSPGSSLYIDVGKYRPSDMWFLVTISYDGWRTSTGRSGKSYTISLVVNQPMQIYISWTRNYIGLIGVGSCIGIAVAGVLFRGKLKRATTVLVRSLRSRREEEMIEQPPSTMVYSDEGEVIPAREFTEVRTSVSTSESEEKRTSEGGSEGENPVS